MCSNYLTNGDITNDLHLVLNDSFVNMITAQMYSIKLHSNMTIILISITLCECVILDYKEYAIQWNLCIMDTLGPTKGVLIIKVS